jgi:hypothetical protein
MHPPRVECVTYNELRSKNEGTCEHKELCCCRTLIVISFSFFSDLFTLSLVFFFSSDPSLFFFYLLQLLHPYIGVKILFDVIINWENLEHHGMDEGSSSPPPTPSISVKSFQLWKTTTRINPEYSQYTQSAGEKKTKSFFLILCKSVERIGVLHSADRFHCFNFRYNYVYA